MRRSPKTVLAAFAALAILSSVPTSAYAGDEASAEVLFREGVDFMKAGDFAKACEAFAGSNKSDPSPGTQINLAICNEKQGKLASAWTWYLSAVPLAKEKNQTDRADTARKEAARLEPLLHKLVINADPKLPGLTVTRDGTPMAPESVGRAIPIDPGEHVIEVSAKGKKPWKTTVNMAATPGVDTLAVPPLEDAPEDQVAPIGPGGGPATADDGGSKRTLGLVLGGAGLAVLAGAGVVQILALGQDSDAKDIRSELAGQNGRPDCLSPNTPLDTQTGGTTCGALRSKYDEERDGASTKQTIALVLGGAGVVMVGVGATLFFTSRGKSSSSAKTTPHVAPFVSPTQAGFSLTGRF